MSYLKKYSKHSVTGKLIVATDKDNEDIHTVMKLPVVPHEAAPEVSKGNLYIKQKKIAPIEIARDMFEHFALRATLFAELFFD